MEMPPEVFIDPLELIRSVGRDGVRVIVAQPERYAWAARRPRASRDWTDAGAALQINAGSLLGEFGQEVEKAASSFLSMSIPLVVATDAHDVRHRPPRLREVFHRIEKPRRKEDRTQSVPGRSAANHGFTILPLAKEGIRAERASEMKDAEI